jgi:hypothetical protein
VAAGMLREDTDPNLAIDMMMGAALYRWLVTAQPVDAAAGRRIVDAVWASMQPVGA